jgi:hypothetical protein
MENIADRLRSEIFTRKFQSFEAIIFLCVTLIFSNYLYITPLDYVSLSSQKKWQNVMRLVRTRWLTGLSYTSASVSFVFDELVTSSEKSYRVFVCVYVCVCVCVRVRELGSLTNNRHSLSISWSATVIINLKFTYRHLNWSRRLLPAPRQRGVQKRLALLQSTFQNKLRVSKEKYIFTVTPDTWDRSRFRTHNL